MHLSIILDLILAVVCVCFVRSLFPVVCVAVVLDTDDACTCAWCSRLVTPITAATVVILVKLHLA